MPKHQPKQTGDIALARTLGIPEVTLLGIGALLGGGIFTLLGGAAGLAGGGLVVSMILGSAIAFINLNAYVALATTFPQAGGGYHWIKEGLGDLAGFLSGWCSWMASAVACALYAVSFGFFMQELAFDYLAIPHSLFPDATWETIFTLSVVALFAIIHYRGVKLSGKIGGIIAMSIIVILVLYLTYGAQNMVVHPELLHLNFTPFFSMGLAGVIQAAALFYIAFEGSEIQAQAGEEVENPAKVLKIGLFSSWAIVSIIYVLVAIVIIGATNGGGVPSSQFLGGAAERAIIVSASGFMPFGYLIMLIGGLLANLAALNATIYSSSRVLFSLGRDRLVFSQLGKMHPIHFVPTRALLASVVVIAFVSTLLPLEDIASAADILFIVLFLQLNIAYIQLRRQKPEAKWQYIVPFEPFVPLAGVFFYILLGFALFHVSPVAIYFLCIWVLIGLVNYFAFAKLVEREDQAREVVYEHSTRFNPKSEYRVVLPVGTEENWQRFTQIAGAMTKQEGGDLMALRIHEMKGGGNSRYGAFREGSPRAP
ncbi:MAG: Amino acid permease-associated region [Parcubacteria group bacterium GW2011_GWA2_47_7]|nr:MAG: Amino acid permease-associated region [Parcubacteria group bacterium GW2011_GWA2_47_7]